MQITNEQYHVYNRGAHKALIFQEKSDYEHFQFLLYKCNNANKCRLNLHQFNQRNRFNHERDPLVEIFTYCLMPNHYHIGLKQVKNAGIYTFMRKLSTSYTMYYNSKYQHSGTVFQGRYKSKHIDTDEYLRYILRYIHLNPFNVDDPELSKSVRDEDIRETIEKCKIYQYSSMQDYLGVLRPHNSILTLLQVQPA